MSPARILVCACPGEALAGAREEDSFALLIGGDGGFSLAFMTVFGPCVRAYPVGDGHAFILDVARQHAASGSRRAYVWSDGPAAAEVARGLADTFEVHRGTATSAETGLTESLQAFRSVRPRGCTQAWTIAPLHGVPFETGQRVRPSIHGTEGRWIVRWAASDGRDAGIHVVTGRAPTVAESEAASACDARVDTATLCQMPDGDGGSRLVQVLVLDVGTDFAEAFPDGRRPRHGVLVPEAA